MRNSWLINSGLLTGAILCLLLSAVFELKAYDSIDGDLMIFTIPLAWAMAFTFNYCKIALLWVMGRSQQTGNKLLANTSKLLTVILSLVASMVVITSGSDQTNMDSVLSDVRLQTQRQFAEREQIMLDRHIKAENELLLRYSKVRNEIQSHIASKIERYEDLLLEEMENKNKQTGNFIGKRYNEFKRQLNEVKNDLTNQLVQIRGEETSELQTLRSSQSQELSNLYRNRDHSLASISRENFNGKEEVQNQIFIPILRLINASFNTALTPVDLALLISILITLVVELTPMALVLYLAKSET